MPRYFVRPRGRTRVEHRDPNPKMIRDLEAAGFVEVDEETFRAHHRGEPIDWDDVDGDDLPPAA